MAVYTNDLRLKEIATGDESGTWGTSTNTNLSLVAEAFSFGTEAITTNADTHTTTLADGATDPGRSMFLKYTGTLDSTCTITIGPNTISKLWFIENATSGSQNIIIKQGSGATVTIANGQVKAIYSDGAGSGGAMVDAFTDLSVPSFFVSGDLDVDGTTNLDVVDIDGAANFATDVTFTGASANIVFDSSDNALEFADNAKSVFGTDSDMSLFHNGNNGFLDCDTGTLFIQTDSLSVKNSAGTEVQMLAAADGAVALYHNNAEKLATESTGINVTGTVTADGLTVDGSATITTADNTAQLVLKSTDADSSTGPILDLQRDSGSPADSDLIGFIRFRGDDDGGNVTNYATIQAQIADVTGGTEDGTLKFQTMVAGSVTTGLAIAGGNVGIGTSSPSNLVEASKSQNTVTDVKVINANTGTAAQARFTLGNSGSNFGSLGFTGGSFTTSGVFRQDGVYLFGNGAGGLSLVTGAAQPIYFAISNSEAARIDSSGNLLVGKTSADNTTQGIRLLGSSGFASFVRASAEPIVVNRLTDDGDLIEFRADGTTVGTIGNRFNALYIHSPDGTNGSGLRFFDGVIQPCESNGNDSDGDTDLGQVSSRFKDLHLSADAFIGGNAGIGTTSPAQTLHVKTGSDGGGITIQRNSTTENTFAQLGFSPTTNDAGSPNISIRGYRGSSFNTNYLTFVVGGSGSGLERMRIDSSGNVGIGTSSPTAKKSSTTLQVNGNVAVGDNNAAGIVAFGDISSADVNVGIFRGASGVYSNTNGNSLGLAAYDDVVFTTGNADIASQSERMRLLSNGTLLVGKTADDNSVGFKTNTSSTYMVASGGTPTFINRLSDNGDLLEFRKDSSTKGRIGTDGTDIFIGSDDTNLLFHADGFLPANSVGGVRDNAFALGSSSARYTDLRLSGVMYSGSALIGTTSAFSDGSDNSGGSGALHIARDNGTCVFLKRASANGAIAKFFRGAISSAVGTITIDASSTAYNTSSDQRLKENIADADDAGSKVDAIKVRQFDWKTDGSHQDYGMVAQELQSVAPEAVAGNADSDEMMGVDYSKLVPMLIKEIQSLRARVAQLETEE